MAKPRILCVDDRSENLLIRKMMLELFGCEVIAVSDVTTALAVLAQDHIDLALIDYHLEEEVDGEQLARAIRESNPKIGLIMLTGDPKIPESARESVDVLLIKGASNPRDLLDAIQELLPEATLRTRRPKNARSAPPKAS